MEIRRLTLFAGHYGSGKTNIAINYALYLKRAGYPVSIADLDIVNPYYRTKDSEEMLSENGIDLIVSPYANSNVDLPSMPKEIYGLVCDPSRYGVLDIGGDDRGALALGRYAADIVRENNYEMLLVINRARPLTRTPEDTVEVLREMEQAGGIPFTGIVNNTNLVFSNVTEMMSRQLSNLLNRMDIPVDLGVGYQQNSSGTDLYDVSVSTELFDNRVEVRGSFGNRQYSTSTNPNGDMVGDLDIDVKLDRPGELRLNLFSHSADEYTSYLDYSQRNGVGITYQKEFNKWGDFWKGLFRSRKKRQQMSRDANQNEAKRTITIEADE